MFSRSSLPAALLASSSIVVPAQAVTLADAEGSYQALQRFYNESIGLWIPSDRPGGGTRPIVRARSGEKGGCFADDVPGLTVIADLAAIDGGVKAQSESVFGNTFREAQLYNLQMQKALTVFPANTCRIGDDEGWWALAWIAAYDVTGNWQYLATAESIFEDMKAAAGTTPCGGLIWWDKSHTYVNATANELFLDVAAHLANRGGNRATYYLSWPQKQWAAFKASGMINDQNTINDGLNITTCKNNGGTVWSYNQGVILGGLTELSKATRDNSYITTAKQIADAAIANLTVNGILHDVCEPDCGADGSQFKGVFARNLQILQQASPETRYATFLQDNANSIWANDRAGQDELSLIWSGPFIQPANASTQSSAMDAIVGALATS
ncbi:hypothetical protein LTR91_023952 [Friedmanniomyces endolithicus]|uniref:Glycoside hydrolase family 76 protein n=1 Tax=Friedmanniomyces endolithicus TaxID=329885 RepID=A0AAN6H327_9PEZI|nr:hypothetical protein LTS02_004637 [Friedmanniomyces endolithicus]KAK0910248.1 hypothetical protein LTR57_015983 [Friedmanniomyces endolithicus]KAK0953244.1 hypothetical protein LTR91_023952 [Friedmanniomyces endolithicus]KAK1034995.1 hypothetical protein LTS16_014952 [Friedmanniomyces endolithicus]